MRSAVCQSAARVGSPKHLLLSTNDYPAPGRANPRWTPAQCDWPNPARPVSWPRMIRNNPLTTVLVCLLFLAGLLCCWFSLWWFLSTRQLQTLRYQYQWMTKTTTAVQSLANEVLE